MLFRKKREKESLYLKPPQFLTVSNEDLDSFSLPSFDEGPISARIAERAELIRSKIDNGDLDGENGEFISLAYSALDQELQAEINAYRLRCAIELDRLKFSLRDQASAHSTFFEKASAPIAKLNGSS